MVIMKRRKAGAKKPNEMIKIGGKWLHRYAYRDTPKGTWREDRKTGRMVWRKLDSNFPAK